MPKARVGLLDTVEPSEKWFVVDRSISVEGLAVLLGEIAPVYTAKKLKPVPVMNPEPMEESMPSVSGGCNVVKVEELEVKVAEAELGANAVLLLIDREPVLKF